MTLPQDPNEAPATPQYFDPLAVMVGEFARDFVEPESRMDAIDRLYSLLNEARAASRAEGLDVERLRREFGYLLDIYGARNDESGHWANCRDMLGLSPHNREADHE